MFGLSVPVLATCVFISASFAANHQGDLVIYKGGLTVGPIGEQLLSPQPPSGNAILLMLDMSPIEGEALSTEFHARKAKIISTIKLLIEGTGENRLSEDTLVGLGSYPNSRLSTASIHVSVGRLGPIGSAHRQRLLNSLNQLQNTDAIGSMSAAYSEAGMYMVGSKQDNNTAPNYRVCRSNAELATSANPYLSYSTFDNQNNSLAESAVVQHAAIFFMTSGMPSTSLPLPLAAIRQSLSPLLQTGVAESDLNSNPLMAQVELMTSASSINNQNLCRFSSAISPPQQHWQCMSEYAKRLNSTSNPSSRAINTGVFVIAPDKIVMNNSSCKVTSINSPLSNTSRQLQITNYQNACQLGSRQVGGGGFYITDLDISNRSIQTFADAIKQRSESLGSLSMKPEGMLASGSMSVPASPLGSGELTTQGFMPMVVPNWGAGKSQWQGGLQRYINSYQGYMTEQGERPSQATSRLIKGVNAGYGLSESSTTGLETDSHAQDTNAVYLSRLQAGRLTKIDPAMSSISHVRLFSDITDTVTSKDILLQRLLLNYMGYSVDDYHPESTTDSQIRLSKIPHTSNGIALNRGAVIHSTPVSFAAKATLDEESGDYIADNQYLLFGAMDNALHVINSHSGKEVFAYFPREVLAHKGQYKGITAELTADKHKGDNTPSFGVDGPWQVYTKYKALTDTTIIAEAIYAYGGARLGAQAYYGLDLTDIDKVRAPKQLFSITKSGVFKRLGYGWGKPVVTKIRWQGQPKLVVIFSGGYDSKYDKTNSQIIRMSANGNSDNSSNSKTEGNTIYIVDAISGKPLIVISHLGDDVNQPQANNADGAYVSSNHTTSPLAVLNSHMRYSITGGVKVLDRDADELADHVYFADLNGQYLDLILIINHSVMLALEYSVLPI